MFYAPLTVGVIIAGHDRRHSGGKPELSASEGRKRLLPFQLTAAAEGERMCIFDELVFKLPTLEMIPVAVVAGKAWTTHRSVCQIWSYSEEALGRLQGHLRITKHGVKTCLKTKPNLAGSLWRKTLVRLLECLKKKQVDVLKIHISTWEKHCGNTKK